MVDSVSTSYQVLWQSAPPRFVESTDRSREGFVNLSQVLLTETGGLVGE
jgi:hypothetical protein